MRRERLTTILILLMALLAMPGVMAEKSAAQAVNRAQKDEAPLYITLWFDTEDYVLPQSDDAALRLAEMLTRLGVTANFKLVGEKARVLEKRGRRDVIAALKRHEIGYHSNLHSGQPTPAVYLQHMGWEDGADEFHRREVDGVRDIERIFGVTPICYGQPGSSWAAQTYPALRKMGIRMYLDESGHVGIDDQPFYYGGMFNVTRMRSNTLRLELGKNDNLATAQEKFAEVSRRLTARGGGTISIYYHPCEFVHREFWDGVNFRRGESPLPSELKPPPMQTAEEIERNYRDFEAFVSFLKAQRGVRFVTGAELMKSYADGTRNRIFGTDELRPIAAAVQKEISYFSFSGLTGPAKSHDWLSAAESFHLLNNALLGQPASLPLAPIDGPADVFKPGAGSSPLSSIRYAELLRTARDVDGFLRTHGRIPDQVWVGTSSLSPADYLATIGGVIEEMAVRGVPPAMVTIRAGRFTAESQVAVDSEKLWGWVIFPEGFHSPRIMEQARLQAWTLKPAALHNR
jgi:hypothetical protein